MLKETELRIGNFVEWPDSSKEQVRVDTISSDALDKPEHIMWFINGEWIEDFIPIPLSRKWFESFGFGYDSKNFEFVYVDEDNGVLICIDDTVDFVNMPLHYYNLPKEHGSCLGYVDYVHQLQNWIFILTGKELELR